MRRSLLHVTPLSSVVAVMPLNTAAAVAQPVAAALAIADVTAFLGHFTGLDLSR